MAVTYRHKIKFWDGILAQIDSSSVIELMDEHVFYFYFESKYQTLEEIRNDPEEYARFPLKPDDIGSWFIPYDSTDYLNILQPTDTPYQNVIQIVFNGTYHDYQISGGSSSPGMYVNGQSIDGQYFIYRLNGLSSAMMTTALNSYGEFGDDDTAIVSTEIIESEEPSVIDPDHLYIKAPNNGRLYVKIPKTETEDVLAGTWVFNDNPDLSQFSSATIFGLQFTCNSVDYSAITLYESTFGYFVEVYIKYDDIFAYGDAIPAWNYEIYKTITITSKLSEVEKGDELLTWLQANATKQSSEVTATSTQNQGRLYAKVTTNYEMPQLVEDNLIITSAYSTVQNNNVLEVS